MTRGIRRFFLAAAALVSTGTETGAQDWEVRVTPYGWLSGLSGDVGAIPGVPAGSVDLSFGDILEDLDFAGMLMASARNGPWVVYLDTTHVRTSSTESLGGVVFDRVEVESETTTFALALGRTIAQTPQGSVDAYLGARGWWLETTFDLRGVGGGASRRTEKADWVNPLVGVAGHYRLADRRRLFGALEVGGFGVGAANGRSSPAPPSRSPTALARRSAGGTSRSTTTRTGWCSTSRNPARCWARRSGSRGEHEG